MYLTKEVPRSPFEAMGGMVFLARAIDKGRSDLAGRLGEDTSRRFSPTHAYVSRRGRSAWLFEFLGITADDFIEALRTRPTDDEVWEWVSSRMKPRTTKEIEEFDDMMCSRSPDDGDWTWKSFRSFLEECGHGHRADIKRNFDRLDLDEGREVPLGGRWWR